VQRARQSRQLNASTLRLAERHAVATGAVSVEMVLSLFVRKLLKSLKMYVCMSCLCPVRVFARVAAPPRLAHTATPQPTGIARVPLALAGKGLSGVGSQPMMEGPMVKPDIDALGVQRAHFIVLPRQSDRLKAGGGHFQDRGRHGESLYRADLPCHADFGGSPRADKCRPRRARGCCGTYEAARKFKHSRRKKARSAKAGLD